MWLYLETSDVAPVASLWWSILWLVVPSLTLSVATPLLLKRDISFPLTLSISLLVMITAYVITTAS